MTGCDDFKVSAAFVDIQIAIDNNSSATLIQELMYILDSELCS